MSGKNVSGKMVIHFIVGVEINVDMIGLISHSGSSLPPQIAAQKVNCWLSDADADAEDEDEDWRMMSGS